MKECEALSKAYRVASNSPDPSNQVGAGVEGRGYWSCNDFPPGISSGGRLKDREIKYRYIEHAERNCIYAATRGVNVCMNGTMVANWACCHECARAIICAGFKKLAVHRERMDLTPERWKKSVKSAFDMLIEANVEVEYYSGPVEGPDVLVNGRLWSPRTLRFV